MSILALLSPAAGLVAKGLSNKRETTGLTFGERIAANKAAKRSGEEKPFGFLGLGAPRGDASRFMNRGNTQPKLMGSSGGGSAAKPRIGGTVSFGSASGNMNIPLILAIAVAAMLLFKDVIFGTRKRRRR